MNNTHALIIDDNIQNLEVLARLLAVNGVIHTAINEPNQLEDVLATLDRVDIVFLDLEMPSRNGYQLLQVLKNLLGDGTPIIACTVHSNEISHARNLGFDGFISKPLSPSLFASQLSQIMQGKAVWDAT